MKAKVTRLLITLSTVGMIAFAGGASLRGFSVLSGHVWWDR